MDPDAAWRNDLVFDHAFVLVKDLEAADARMRKEFGLGSVAGGTFPDYPGLANRLVPMQEGFLELIAVTDRDPAGGSDEARYWTERLALQGEHIAGWALRSERLDEAATDLGFDIEGPDRAILDGGSFEMRWSVIWPDADPPSMPFLIRYEDFGSLRALLDRGLLLAEHERRPLHVEALEIGGNLHEIEARVGSPVPIRTAPGPDRVIAIVIATLNGSIEFRWD